MGKSILLGAIVVVGLAVAGAAAEPVLFGSWNADVTIDPTQPSFADAISLWADVKVGYGIGDWVITSHTLLSENGWVAQDFETTGTIGAVDIRTGVWLHPDGTLSQAATVVSTSLAGVSLQAFAELIDGDTVLSLNAAYDDGITKVSLDVDFGDQDQVCDLPFAAALIEVGWTFCCADVRFLAHFTCSGFSQAGFIVEDLAVPALPWLSLDAGVAYRLGIEDDGGKTVMLSPTFDFGDTACFDLYFDVDHDHGHAPQQTLDLKAIEVVGIGIVCDIAGVLFEATSYWGEPRLVELSDAYGHTWMAQDFPGVLTGYGQEYWEGYRITTTEDACCGPLEFSIAALFKEGIVDQLFDVDLFDAQLGIEMSEHVTFRTGLKIDAGTGAKALTIGLHVTWGEAPEEEQLELIGPII